MSFTSSQNMHPSNFQGTSPYAFTEPDLMPKAFDTAAVLMSHAYMKDNIPLPDGVTPICSCGYSYRAYAWYPDWVVHVSNLICAVYPSWPKEL